MRYTVSDRVAAVSVSPVSEAKGWLTGRTFPAAKPLLDVAQAVPGYPPAPALNDHLAGLLSRTETSLYTPIFGMPELRGALAEHLSDEYNGRVAAEQVAITAGCNQAFCMAVSTLAAPGDEVLLPLPWYFNYQMWLDLQGIQPVGIPFVPESGTPDPEAAARLITPRTRAIVLVTPNNPTGAVYAPAVIDAFFELAAAHGIALIVDETYKDFRPDPGSAHGLFQRADWPNTLIQLYSFSKAYSLTGYRVGAFSAHADFLEQVGKLMDCVAICAPRIGQEAALYGLQHLAAWRNDKRQLMNERAAALRTAFNQPGLGYQLTCAGAYFAYVQHPFSGRPARQVARDLLDQQHLLCLPGSHFGPEQEDYLRVAFANLEAGLMPELVARLLASQD